jgi:hypothetical protein
VTSKNDLRRANHFSQRSNVVRSSLKAVQTDRVRGNFRCILHTRISRRAPHESSRTEGTDDIPCRHIPSYQAPRRGSPAPRARESDTAIPLTDQASHESKQCQRRFMHGMYPLKLSCMHSASNVLRTANPLLQQVDRMAHPYQKYSVRVLSRWRHSVQVVVCIAIQFR